MVYAGLSWDELCNRGVPAGPPPDQPEFRNEGNRGAKAGAGKGNGYRKDRGQKDRGQRNGGQEARRKRKSDKTEEVRVEDIKQDIVKLELQEAVS